MLDKRSSGTFPIWKIGSNEINVAILLHDMANSPKTLSLSDDSPIIYLFPLANFSTALRSDCHFVTNETLAHDFTLSQVRYNV